MPTTVTVATVQPAIPLNHGLQEHIKPWQSRSASDQFFWSYTEEPHRTRRQAIIKAHPEVLCRWCLVCYSIVQSLTWAPQVTKLCGYEPLTKYLVLAVVSLQIACAAWLRRCPILSARFLLVAYIVGATANQNLFLAIHEISHNLAFKSATANRLFAILANLPIGVPYSAAFRVSWALPRLSLQRNSAD